MGNDPLVTVNILSFNRKDDLRNTLTKVFEQDYKNIEVTVVDNASGDSSPEMVEKEFPAVKLIKLKRNIGIAGWNEGFKIAKGEYILVLDDDSYPKENNCISLALREFTDEKIGILSFKIFNILFKEDENSIISTKAYPYFIGCGAMIKKEVLNNIGLYNDSLFLYNHEDDYTLRLYDKGYTIKFIDSIVINHRHSNINRTSKRRKYYTTRNMLIILFLHYNLNKVAFRLFRIILGRLLSGIKQGEFLNIFRGTISFILLIPKLISQRRPLKPEIQKLFNFGACFGGFHFEDIDWNN